jgi:hypothetical protein
MGLMRLLTRRKAAGRIQDIDFQKGGVMLNKICVALVVAFACLVSPGMAQQNTPPAPARVDNIVKYCVEFVHAFPAHNQMDVTTNEGFFNKFDAFYNPATGTVQSNATEVVGDLEPLYEFNKCMAGEGFPLK